MTLKKVAFVVLLIAFLAFVYAGKSARDIPMEQLHTDLQQEKTLRSLTQCDDRDLLQFFDLDAQAFDGYLYYKSEEALSVEELLIIKCKDPDALSQAMDAVESRVDSQIQTFNGYGPTQTALLEDAIIEIRGDYLFYCTSPQAEQYEEVFLHAV